MGDQLRGRRCRVTIAVPVKTPGNYTDVTTDQLVINGGDDPADPGMRVRFQVTKTAEKDPNTSTVTITNLAGTTRGSLQVKGVKVTLEAGYQATGLTRIFLGDARTVDSTRDGPNWQTVFRLGDGERGFRYARLSESFGPGTSAADVLRRLANASGLALGNVPTKVLEIAATFDQGYVVNGLVSRSLDRLVSSLGYAWSIQDGALQVLAPNDSLGAQIPLISPDTGLIGSPEMGTPDKSGKPALCKFRSLLTPTIPGGKVHLRSERYDAEVVIKKCTYTGDTHGQDWYTDMEGVIQNAK